MIAIFASILVATNSDHLILPRGSLEDWVRIIGGALALLVLLTIGKDVVDNDVDVEGRMIGSGPTGTITPSNHPKAAGS